MFVNNSLIFAPSCFLQFIGEDLMNGNLIQIADLHQFFRYEVHLQLTLYRTLIKQTFQCLNLKFDGAISLEKTTNIKLF